MCIGYKDLSDGEETKILIFMHVPKSGGSTFYQEILLHNFSGDKIYPAIRTYQDYQVFKNESEKIKSKYKCISGHFPFGIHEYISTPSKNNKPETVFKYVTFIRHPVSRIYSLYRYVRSGMVSNEYKNAIFGGNQNISFIDFVKLKLPDGNSALQNLTTSMITNYNKVSFKRAQNNIEKWFPCVGVLEKFEKSLFVISELYGLKIPDYKKRNVTQSNLTLSSEELLEAQEVINKRNKDEIVLYEYCLKRLLRQFKDISDGH